VLGVGGGGGGGGEGCSAKSTTQHERKLSSVTIDGPRWTFSPGLPVMS